MSEWIWQRRELTPDVTNQNNHVGIKRQEDIKKAEGLLNLINEYRRHTVMHESLPTWDILEFLQKLDVEVNERYNKEVEDWERYKLKEQYFLLTHKKPFGWWSDDEIRKRIQEFVDNNKWENTDWGFRYKKSQWKKAS